MNIQLSDLTQVGPIATPSIAMTKSRSPAKLIMELLAGGVGLHNRIARREQVCALARVYQSSECALGFHGIAVDKECGNSLGRIHQPGG